MKAKQEQAVDYLRAHQALCRAESTPGEEMITEALSWLEDVQRLQADNSRLMSGLLSERDRVAAAREILSE